MNNNDRTRPKYISTLVFTGGGGGGGTGTITVQDEGSEISNTVQTLNFVGADVQVLGSGSLVSIYVPPPVFSSHWNTSDGTTNGTVTESISRTTAMIGAPTSEGTPFKTGGWAGTNQAATLSSSVTFTSAGDVTGFSANSGGDATMTITVYDADGTTVLETLTTSTIYQDGSYGAGNITVTISNYGADATRYKARPSITVNVGAILSDGGRYNCVVSMSVDTATDGTGVYTFTQTSVFYDTNPNTPTLSGVTIGETGGSVLTKHLSGVEYYILNSAFTVAVADIDNLNRNTARTSQNLFLDFQNYGITDLNQSPLSGGAGSSNFSGWTTAYDNVNTSYSNTAATITSSNFRYRGTAARVRGRVRDPWANSSYVNSSSSNILIDTYGTTSTNLTENFTDESRRQDSGFNSGSTSGNWNSSTALATGEAMVIGGQLIVPSAATLTSGGANANWSSYSPSSGGANPDYSLLVAPVNYYRTIVDNVGGTSRAGFTITFSGSFVSNATTDLANQNLKIFISRIASATGGKTGATNPDFLEIHGAVYNFATFDDGTTDGHIRESSSSGNTVNCTFGGFDCQDGFYMHIEIANASIKISSLSVSFS